MDHDGIYYVYDAKPWIVKMFGDLSESTVPNGDAKFATSWEVSDGTRVVSLLMVNCAP